MKLWLARCPFCGSKKVYLYGGKFHWVKCDNCGVKSKMCKTAEEAQELWNIRYGKKLVDQKKRQHDLYLKRKQKGVGLI